MVSKSELQLRNPRSFPGGENKSLLFNSDIVNFLLKASGRRGRRHNFVVFVVCTALDVGGVVGQKILFRAG